MRVEVDGHEVYGAQFVASDLFGPVIRGWYVPRGELMPYSLGDFPLQKCREWTVLPPNECSGNCGKIPAFQSNAPAASERSGAGQRRLVP